MRKVMDELIQNRTARIPEVTAHVEICSSVPARSEGKSKVVSRRHHLALSHISVSKASRVPWSAREARLGWKAACAWQGTAPFQ